MKKIYLVRIDIKMQQQSMRRLLPIAMTLITLLFLNVQTTYAQLLQWNTFGNLGTETTEASVFNNVNVSTSNLSMGPGLTAQGNANRFGGSNWFNTGNPNPNTIANAVAGNDYIQFTVTPNGGFSFTPTSLVFNWDKSGTGPQNVALRSSVDAFASNLGTVAPTASIGVSNTITISGLTALTTATIFRIYGYGATAIAGTGGFDIGSNVVNVQLNGTTASLCNLPVINSVNVTQPSCSVPTGSIDINATGTVLEYSIDAGSNWLPGSSFSGLFANNYIVQVRNTTACVATYTSNPVVVNAAPGPYTITASAGANGSISPAGMSTVNCGTDNVYTFMPNSCYQVADVLVDGDSQGSIQSYTFSNTSANHTISVSFAATTAPATPGEVSGPKNVCPYIGSTEQVTYSIAPVANATSYQWTLPPTVSLVSGQGTSSIVVTIENGFIATANKLIKVQALSACGNSGEQLFYLVAQASETPHAIRAGSDNICSFIGTGNAVSYTIDAVPGASSYSWTTQAGTTSIFHAASGAENDTTVLVTFENNFTTSLITVQTTNACGTSSLRSLLIERNIVSKPGPITGPTNVCANIAPSGTPGTYSIVPVSGATSYTWTTPTGSIVTHPNGAGANDNRITVLFPADFTNDSIQVRANNTCGVSDVRSLRIKTLRPSSPSGIAVTENAACPNRVYNYALMSQPYNSTSILWTVPVGGTILSGQGSISITVSYAATSINGEVTATASNLCGNSSTRNTPIALSACAGTSPVLGKSVKQSIYMDEKLTVNLASNPTVSDYRVQVVSISKEKILLRVLDIHGRELKRIQTMPNVTTVFGSDLKSGTYFLEISQGGIKKTQQLVKF